MVQVERKYGKLQLFVSCSRGSCPARFDQNLKVVAHVWNDIVSENTALWRPRTTPQSSLPLVDANRAPSLLNLPALFISPASRFRDQARLRRSAQAATAFRADGGGRPPPPRGLPQPLRAPLPPRRNRRHPARGRLLLQPRREPQRRRQPRHPRPPRRPRRRRSTPPPQRLPVRPPRHLPPLLPLLPLSTLWSLRPVPPW